MFDGTCNEHGIHHFVKFIYFLKSIQVLLIIYYAHWLSFLSLFWFEFVNHNYYRKGWLNEKERNTMHSYLFFFLLMLSFLFYRENFLLLKWNKCIQSLYYWRSVHSLKLSEESLAPLQMLQFFQRMLLLLVRNLASTAHKQISRGESSWKVWQHVQWQNMLNGNFNATWTEN